MMSFDKIFDLSAGVYIYLLEYMPVRFFGGTELIQIDELPANMIPG